MKNINNSENYDIVFCPLCNQDAKLPDHLDGFNPCVKCGGFGVVMKEERAAKKKQRSTQLSKDVSISY